MSLIVVVADIIISIIALVDIQAVFPRHRFGLVMSIYSLS